MKQSIIGFLAAFLILGIMGFKPMNSNGSKKDQQQEIEVLKEQVNRLNERVTALELNSSKKKNHGLLKR